MYRDLFPGVKIHEGILPPASRGRFLRRSRKKPTPKGSFAGAATPAPPLP
jgi:hypothetical protein